MFSNLHSASAHREFRVFHPAPHTDIYAQCWRACAVAVGELACLTHLLSVPNMAGSLSLSLPPGLTLHACIQKFVSRHCFLPLATSIIFVCLVTYLQQHILVKMHCICVEYVFCLCKHLKVKKMQALGCLFIVSDSFTCVLASLESPLISIRLQTSTEKQTQCVQINLNH